MFLQKGFQKYKIFFLTKYCHEKCKVYIYIYTYTHICIYVCKYITLARCIEFNYVLVSFIYLENKSGKNIA